MYVSTPLHIFETKVIPSIFTFRAVWHAYVLFQFLSTLVIPTIFILLTCNLKNNALEKLITPLKMAVSQFTQL